MIFQETPFLLPRLVIRLVIRLAHELLPIVLICALGHGEWLARLARLRVLLGRVVVHRVRRGDVRLGELGEELLDLGGWGAAVLRIIRIIFYCILYYIMYCPTLTLL